MSDHPAHVRKITVSLPARLVAFADCEAARLNTNRSDVIACALARLEDAERDRLASEGYEFYAEEACEFADACAGPLGEGISGGS
jgi:Arc/MetJ-type ribon-helix-helix transcriptional regulator